MKKIISLVLVLILSFGVVTSSFANSSLNEISSEDINSLNSKLKEPLDPQKMSKSQKKKYYKAIEKQVKIAKKEGKDPIKFRKALVTLLEKNKFVIDNSDSYYINQKIMPRGGTWIPDVHISNEIVGPALEVVISTIIAGAGAASVSGLVKKIGKREARKLFSKTIKSKLIAWGCKTLISYHIIDSTVDFIFNYLNWGNRAAKWLDSKDDIPNNGYLDKIL